MDQKVKTALKVKATSGLQNHNESVQPYIQSMFLTRCLQVVHTAHKINVHELNQTSYFIECLSIKDFMFGPSCIRKRWQVRPTSIFGSRTMFSSSFNQNKKKKTFKNKALKSPRGRQNLFIYLQAVSPSQTLKSVEAGSLAKNNVYSCRRLMVRQMG